jgi:hypothetical protein
MNMQPYEYVVLKYVHDPVANESLNIGVLLLSLDENMRFFQGRFEQRYRRLSEVFSRFDGEHFRRFVSRLQRQVDLLSDRLNDHQLFSGQPPTLNQLMTELIPDAGMSFRFEKILSGIADDPAEELNHQFFRFVTSQYEWEQVSNRNDEEVWNTFKAPLKALRVLDRLVEKTFTADEFEYTFPRAFKNGKWHVLESVSFDYVRAEQVKQKATNYLGIATALSRNPEMGKMYLLLGKPTRVAHLKQYERAKRLLSDHLQVDHVLVEEEEAESLAASVSEFMENHPHESA